MLFSRENNIKEIDLDTRIVKDLAYQNTPAYSLTYDVTGGHVYVARPDENVIVRYRTLVTSYEYLFLDLHNINILFYKTTNMLPYINACFTERSERKED